MAVDLLYFTGKRGGTETYVRRVLPTIAARSPELDLVAIANTTAAPTLRDWFPGEVRTLPIDGEFRPLWALAEYVAVAPAAARADADLLWCPANFGPPGGRVPRLVTLHDAIAFEHPNPQVSGATRAVTADVVRRAARGASHLLTDSEDAAAAIVRSLGIDRSRITPVALAGSVPTPVDDPAGHLAELGLQPGRPLVLSTGNRLPHKNFDGLLRAVATIPAEERPQVAITGSHGPDPLRALVAALGLESDVHLLGWVSHEQLESLYQVANVYVCPSLVEGFGLPVLDAMARGTAVLANDIAVLREVGDSAARYADARDPEAFGVALRSLLSDADTRRAMHAAGIVRAGQFSWHRAAEQTGDVILDVLARSPRRR